MSRSGEHPPFTRPDGTIADTKNLWQNAADIAAKLGNVAAETSFTHLANRASLKDSSKRYTYQSDLFNPVTTRVSRAIDGINSEIVNPRKTGLGQLGHGNRLIYFNHSVDGTSLIDSHHQPMLKANAPLGISMEKRLITGEGLRIKPDPYWQAIGASIVILMTNGNPEWQKEELPDLATEKEKTVTTTQAHLDNLAQYNRLRKMLTIRRTPTLFGIDLVHLAETNPKYPPHVQQFLIAQKVENA